VLVGFAVAELRRARDERGEHLGSGAPGDTMGRETFQRYSSGLSGFLSASYSETDDGNFLRSLSYTTPRIVFLV